MRTKILRSGIGWLVNLAFYLAIAAVAWRIVRGTWPSPAVFLASGAGFLAGQVPTRLATRSSRRRGGAAQGGDPQIGPRVKAVGRYGSGEAKGSFDVVMRDAGHKKIQVIKEIREITRLGLKESKDLVDQAPSVVLANVSEDMANEAVAILSAVGAEVIVQYSPQSEDRSGDEPA